MYLTMVFVKLTTDGECCICFETSWALINGLFFCEEHHEEGEHFANNRIYGELENNNIAKIHVKMHSVDT